MPKDLLENFWNGELGSVVYAISVSNVDCWFWTFVKVSVPPTSQYFVKQYQQWKGRLLFIFSQFSFDRLILMLPQQVKVNTVFLSNQQFRRYLHPSYCVLLIKIVHSSNFFSLEYPQGRYARIRMTKQSLYLIWRFLGILKRCLFFLNTCIFIKCYLSFPDISDYDVVVYFTIYWKQ